MTQLPFVDERRIARGYDRLAGSYRTLERLAFAGALDRARFAHLPAVAECRRILLIGDGDGRFLERLLASTRPHATAVEIVELSRAMIERSRRRIPESEQSRVHYHHGSLFDVSLPDAHFDAVVTCFFLDQFQGAALQRAVGAIAKLCRSGALWAVSDFRIPEREPGRVYARLWLALLYRFFGVVTGIQARRLEDPGPRILASGFSFLHEHRLLAGSLYAALWRARERTAGTTPVEGIFNDRSSPA